MAHATWYGRAKPEGLMRYIPCEHGDAVAKKCMLTTFPDGCPMYEDVMSDVGKSEVLDDAYWEKWAKKKNTAPGR